MYSRSATSFAILPLKWSGNGALKKLKVVIVEEKEIDGEVISGRITSAYKGQPVAKILADTENLQRNWRRCFALIQRCWGQIQTRKSCSYLVFFVISISFVIHKHSTTQCRNFRPLLCKPEDTRHGLQLNIAISVPSMKKKNR